MTRKPIEGSIWEYGREVEGHIKINLWSHLCELVDRYLPGNWLLVGPLQLNPRKTQRNVLHEILSYCTEELTHVKHRA